MHQKISSTQTILYLDLENNKSKKVLAYAKSRRTKINIMDWKKEKLTTTMWKELLMKLKKAPKELMDKSKPYYRENIKGKDFKEEDWLNILTNSPFLLKGPILIEGENAILCDNASNVFKF